MQLSSGERSILAYFPSSSTAKEAMAALKKEGISEIQLDRVSRFGVSLDREFNNPIAGQADTITGLTLYSSDTDQYTNNDARVLMATDPSVSGIGADDYGVAGGKAFLLTVVTDEHNLDKAVTILKEMGAYF
ncbi:hypothetical protein [Thermincola potens]|uniref:Uncharacterized protein n=1 Tax=Thermincola potens (strain JR) TaxID=635013 RepID=D5XDS7_THEPJ|nr:hypothetical protein [Thermincola potens]ADG83823.1 conserved hypothetical protein [Thermincola potens JR]